MSSFGFKANPTTKFIEYHVAVKCPACGATKGSRCRGMKGQIITRTHSTRAAACHDPHKFNPIITPHVVERLGYRDAVERRT